MIRTILYIVLPLDTADMLTFIPRPRPPTVGHWTCTLNIRFRPGGQRVKEGLNSHFGLLGVKHALHLPNTRYEYDLNFVALRTNTGFVCGRDEVRGRHQS